MQKHLVPFLCQLLVPLTQGLVVGERQVYSDTWRIQGLTRNLIWAENRVDLVMFIEDGSADGVYCEIIATSGADTDLKTWSFSNYNCVDNDWSVSWGYQYGNDAAVMTVVSPEKNRRAFFGFDHVNTQVPSAHLGNAGPSQVSAA